MKYLILFLSFVAGALCIVGCTLIKVDNLNTAISAGDTNAVHKAIREGVNINRAGMHGVTPLMKAAEMGRFDLCVLLIQNGANVNGHNDTGSVLMYAISAGREDIVRYVLKTGVDVSWKNVLGEDAERMAIQLGKTNLAAIIAKKVEVELRGK